MTDAIKKLTDLFRDFPTIGSRTANRFVFYLLSLPKEKIDELTRALQELKSNITLCSFCFNPYEGHGPLCPICHNPSRNRQLLCVVEKETDLLSIERSKKYHGLYFIVSTGSFAFKKNFGDSLRITALKERVENPQRFGLLKTSFSEIIIATNPTPEGKSTSILIERALRELPHFTNLKITHLAKGLPTGGELEYTDEETLESAFEGRK